MEQRAFLLCPPDYFDAHFLFNAWLTIDETVDRDLAMEQWRTLRCAIVAAGGVVQEIEPSARDSAMVYTRDNAWVYAPGKVLLLRSVGPRGMREPKLLQRWFKQHDYEIHQLPRGMHLEGGNLMWRDEQTLVAGYKPGENVEAYQWLIEFYRQQTGLTIEVIFARLPNDKYLHLDMAVSFLCQGGVLVYPPALHLGETWRSSELWDGRTVIELDAETEYFGANIIEVDDTIITTSVSTATQQALEKLGYGVQTIDLSEFIKGGGGPHCLTLDLLE
ncbi:MAG: arginine deiminase family protein [Candidatus Paceibacterota bacterium]